MRIFSLAALVALALASGAYADNVTYVLKTPGVV